MIVIKKSTVEEIFNAKNFPDLLRGYAEESSIAGLPDPVAKMSSYRMLENSGVFQAYGAFDGDLLVGFIAVLAPIIPHYGVSVTVAESLFVAKEHRKKGAGLKLINMAEHHAQSIGSPGLLLSAPTGGRLADVLPRRGYRETNRVYFKEANYE